MGWRIGFEEYGEKARGIQKTHLYQIAKAAEVQLSLGDSAIAEKKIPETHLRPLAPLTDDERRQVWEEATAQGRWSFLALLAPPRQALFQNQGRPRWWPFPLSVAVAHSP